MKVAAGYEANYTVQSSYVQAAIRVGISFEVCPSGHNLKHGKISCPYVFVNSYTWGTLHHGLQPV